MCACICVCRDEIRKTSKAPDGDRGSGSRRGCDQEDQVPSEVQGESIQVLP